MSSSSPLSPLSVSVSDQDLITSLYEKKQIAVFSIVDEAIQSYMKEVLRITAPVITNYVSEDTKMRMYLKRDTPDCLDAVFSIEFDGSNTRVAYGRAPEIKILSARDMYRVSSPGGAQVFTNPRTARDDAIRYLVQCFVCFACDACDA